MCMVIDEEMASMMVIKTTIKCRKEILQNAGQVQLGISTSASGARQAPGAGGPPGRVGPPAPAAGDGQGAASPEKNFQTGIPL